MKISVVVPVYNSSETLGECLGALISQVFAMDDFEIIVVDNGSTDDSRSLAKVLQHEAKAIGIKIRIIDQKIRGRLAAREKGARVAKYDNLLFIDSRCIGMSDLLKNLSLMEVRPIMGVALSDENHSNYERYFYLIRLKLYKGNFGANSKKMIITEENFDQSPKGTGIFFCPKKIFLEASEKIDKKEEVSDDTRLLWEIVKVEPIIRDPDLKVRYVLRSKLSDNIKHIYKRGPKFADYYLSINKRNPYYYLYLLGLTSLFLVTYMISLKNLTILNIIITLIIISNFLVTLLIAKKIKDYAIVFTLNFIFPVAFGLGILRAKWRQVLLVLIIAIVGGSIGRI